MFKVNEKMALKIGSRLNIKCEYDSELKYFKCYFLDQDHILDMDYRFLDKKGLRIVGIGRVEDHQRVVFIKRKPILPRIIMGVLIFEVLFFSLIIFLLAYPLILAK